jgi:hypothetical protein
MVWWLFKKKGETSSEFQKTVKNSFFNIKDDMSQISQWISHFKEKHDGHESEITTIISRLESIEKQLNFRVEDVPVSEVLEEKETEEKKEGINKEYERWDELTPVQQRLCWKISRLQKEKPKRWLSLKDIAQELYPEREYNKIRSTVSDYIGLLEEFDYIERKRKGRQAYVRFKKNKLPSSKEKTKEKVKKKVSKK